MKYATFSEKQRQVLSWWTPGNPYSNKEAILKLVKDEGIEHVISCANDFGVLTAAYVAEKMGWRGHDTYKNAKLLHLKDEFKEYKERLG